MTMSLVTTPDTINAFIEVSVTDTTEDSTQETDWTTIKSITITPKVANNQPLILKLVCQAKKEGGSCDLRITGDLGNSALKLINNSNYASKTLTISLNANMVPGASYTLNIQAQAGFEGWEVFVKDAVFTLTYLDNTTITIGGSKWGSWS